MKQSTNGQHRWTLSHSIEFKKFVETVVENISDDERRIRVDNAFNAAVAKVLADPLTIGGPRFRFHKLGLTNFIYTSEYFVLHYAVDETRHIVYLRKFILNP